MFYDVIQTRSLKANDTINISLYFQVWVCYMLKFNGSTKKKGEGGYFSIISIITLITSKINPSKR